MALDSFGKGQNEILRFFVDVKADPQKIQNELGAITKGVIQTQKDIKKQAERIQKELKDAFRIDTSVPEILKAVNNIKKQSDKADKEAKKAKEKADKEARKEELKWIEYQAREKKRKHAQRLKEVKERNAAKRKAAQEEERRIKREEELRIRSYERQLQAYRNFAKAGAAVTAAGAAAIIAPTKKAGDFEAEMNRFKAVASDVSKSIDQNEASFDRFQQRALEIASNSKFMSSEVAQAGSIMGKLGLTTDEATDALNGIVLTAEASGESLDKIAQIVVGVKNGFGLLAKDADHIADVLAYSVTNSATSFETLGVSMKYVAPVAKGAGQSLEDVTGILSIMGDNMVLGSTAGTSFRQALIRLAKQTSETKETLDALGVSVADKATGDFKRFPVILKEISEALKGASETTKTMALSTIFGERAITGMMAVIDDSDGLDKLIKGLKGVDGSAQRLKDVAFKGLNAELVKLNSAFDKFMIELGQRFLPIVVLFVKSVKSTVEVFSSLTDTSKSIIATFIGVGTVISGLITIAVTLKTGLIALELSIIGLEWASARGAVSMGLLGKSMIKLQGIAKLTGALMATSLGPWTTLIGLVGAVAIPTLAYWFDQNRKSIAETKEKNKVLDAQIERVDKVSIATYRLIEAKLKLADAEKKLKSGEISQEEYDKILSDVQKRLSSFEKVTATSFSKAFKDEISKTEKEIQRLPEKIEEMKDKLSTMPLPKTAPLFGSSEDDLKHERELLETKIKRSEYLLSTAPKRLAVAQKELIKAEALETAEKKREELVKKMTKLMGELNNSLDKNEVDKINKSINDVEKEIKENAKDIADHTLKLKNEKLEIKDVEEETLRRSHVQYELEQKKLESTGERDKILKSYIESLEKERELTQATLEIQRTQVQLAKERLRMQALMGEQVSAESLRTHQHEFDNSGGISFGGMNKGPQTSPFGYRIHPVHRTSRLHTGIDTALPQGTPVKSHAEGRIAFSGIAGGYGGAVVVDVGGGNFILYAHNSKLYKKVGDTVKKGEVISLSGGRKGTWGAGTSTGPHLHTEFRRGGKEGTTNFRQTGTPFNPNEGFKGSKFTATVGAQKLSFNVDKIDLSMNTLKRIANSDKLEDAIRPDSLNLLDEIIAKEDKQFDIEKLEESYKIATKKYEDLKSVILLDQSKLDKLSRKTGKDSKDTAEMSSINVRIEDKKKEATTALNEQMKLELQLSVAKRQMKQEELKKDAEVIKKRANFARELKELEMELSEKQDNVDGKRIQAAEKNYKIEINNIKKKYNQLAKGASEFVANDKEAADLVLKLRKFRNQEELIAEKKKNEEIQKIRFDSFKKTLDLRKKIIEYNEDEFGKERQLINLNYELTIMSLEHELSLEKDVARQKLLKQIIQEERQKHSLDLIKLTYKEEERRIDVKEKLIQLSEKNNKLLDESNQTVSIFNEQQEKGLSSLARRYKDFQNRFTPSLIVPTDAEIKESVDHLNKKLEQAVNKADLKSSEAAREKDPIKRQELTTEYLTLLEQERQIRKAITDLQDPALKKFRDFIAAQDELNNKAELTKTLFSNIGNVISNIGNEDLGQLIGDIGSSIGSLNASFQEVSKSFTIGDSGDVFKDMNDNLGNLMLGNITDPKQVAKLAAGFSQLFSLAVEGTKLISTGLTKLGESFFGFIFGVGQKEHRKFVLELEKKDIELFKKRNELALKKGDISEALYNTNKLKANAKEYQNTIAEIDLEIKERQNEANAKMGGVLLGSLIGGGIFNQKEREELLKMQIDNAKLELESAKKKEDAQLTKEENERQINLDARRKGMDSIYAITEQRAKINKMEAELSGDAINIIRSESASRMVEIDRRISQSEIEKDANGNTEYEKNRHNLVLKEAALERIKIEKEEYEAILEYKTKRQEAELTNKNESYKLRRDVTEFQKKQIDEDTKYQIEQNRLRNIMKTTDDINIYNETAEKLQNLEKDYTQKTNDNRKAEAEYFESITHDMQMNYAKFTDNKALIEKLSLDNTLKLFDKETKEQSLTLAQNSKAQTEYEKARAKERESIVERSQLNIQSILNDNMKLRNQVEISMAKNTYDQIDDIDADYVARKSEIEQQLIIDIASNKKMEVELTKDANQKILSLEIEKFDKLVQYRKSKLQEEFDVRSMTAELSSNPLDMFGAERQNYFEDLYFDEQVELKRMKAMKASQEDIDKVIKKYELKRKLRNKKDLEELKNAEIERYNQILEVRERIFDIDKRQYELEIKRRDREIDQIQKKIDRLNREKDDLEREADAQRRKFDIEDKKEFEKLVSKYTPDKEIMDALEFISNPTLNTVDDAASKTAIEGLRERLDVQKQLLENSYILENITAEDYYTDLEELLGGAASGATSALATLLTEQQKQIENLQSIGKNEDEIRVVRKSQMKQTAEMQKFIAELYQDFQDNRLTQIDELTQKELDAKDELIRAEEDAVRALEDKNRIAQDAIDALAVKFEEDAEKINKNIDTVKDTMDTFGISIDSVRNNLDALLLGTTSKFETFKTEMKKAFDMSGLTAILNGLNINTNVTASPVTATTARLANTAYVDRNDTGIKLSDIPVRNKYVSPQDGDPDGAFTIEGTSGKWFRTGTEKDSYEKIVGARFGLTPEYDVGGSFDYIPAMLRPNEVVAPVRDFKHLVNRLTQQNMFRNHSMPYMAPQKHITIQIGNVYGELNLERAIRDGVRQAAMEDGAHNAIYAINSN